MFALNGRRGMPRRAATALAVAGAATVGLGGALAATAPALAQDEPAVATVTLTKTYRPNDPDPTVGEAITFTITLTNQTSARATAYQVDGQLPEQLVDGSWTCTATGTGSVCGAPAGTGHLLDIANIGPAGGTVVYELTGTVAVAEQFTQQVLLATGPGQACEPTEDGAPQPPLDQPPDPAHGTGPTHDTGRPGGGYAPPGYPPAPEPQIMTCRVNNVVNPLAQPAAPPVEPQPQPESVPALPNTTPPAVLAYGAAGLGGVMAGAILLWSARRRRP